MLSTVFGDSLHKRSEENILPPSKLFIGSRFSIPSEREYSQNERQSSEVSQKGYMISADRKFASGPPMHIIHSFI
jgi:hypothetical protein